MKNSIIPENQLSAAVKIILLSASFFIFWSALALISSFFHPLSMPWAITPANELSSSLADSLYREVLRSYFSLFTISVLVIILLAAFLGYLYSRQTSARLFPFYENQNPLTVLLKRLFFEPSRTTIDFSDHNAINRFNDSGGQIYGPTKILIQNDAAILISKGMDDFRLMISNGSTPIQISPRERLVRIFSSNRSEFIVDLVNPNSNDLFRSIQFRYTFHLHDLAENINFSGMKILSCNNFSNWKELLDSIIRLEFESLLKIDSGSWADPASMDEQGFSDASENEGSRSQSHSFYFSSKPLIKSKIFRNRKRGIYPLPSLNSDLMDDLETMRAAKETLYPLMNKFLENLTRTTTQLFGFNPIKIIDYEIGEEK